MPLPNNNKLIVSAAALLVPSVLALVLSLPQGGEVRSVIVQGDDLAALKTAVRAVGGEITHELGIIGAVGADLTSSQLEALKRHGNIKQTFADGIVETAGGTPGGSPGPYAHFPNLVGADALQAQGITGESVTVAIVDSGMAAIAELQKDTW